jgi:hypothetical protein
MNTRYAATVLLALGLNGCACSRSAPASTATAAVLDDGEPATPAASGPADTYESVRIEGVPHVQQKPDFCGEACAEMWLRKLGHDIDQDQVFDRAGIDPLAARGAWAPDLKRSLEDIGFDVGKVWYRFAPAKADRELRRLFGEMHTDLQAGIPSIICMRADPANADSEHFRLIVGYDAADDEVIYHEPGAANGAYSPIARAKFIDQWPLKYGDEEWTVIRLRLAAGTIDAHPPAATFTSADYAQHMMQLRTILPDGFTVVLEPPFVVIGDEDPDTVAFRATHTVRWATALLKQDFFARDPDRIIDIWLFGDETSYGRYTVELFNEEPDTPFGFYSPKHDALLMNIATGGGTLVHEIVHPFVAANIPSCPAWINEGLGSLYEACGEREGRIRGLTNWRLAGLQRAIGQDMSPTFEHLTSLNDDPFYGDDSGIYYAQSRYLFYYLEQKGLLRRLVRDYVANQAQDPTGYQTLQAVLGNPDMAAFEQQWRDFVMTLEYPPAT